MVTMKCTKEALAEAMFRLISDEIREMNTFDMLIIRNAYSKDLKFAQVPVKIQAIMIRLGGELIAEFEE